MPYINYSMSYRAAEAYEEGRKPISKWSKEDIIGALETMNQAEAIPVGLDNLKRLSLASLKRLCLHSGEWHHTSCHYNQTSFYEVDEDQVRNLCISDLAMAEKTTGKEKPEEQTRRIKFLTWSGTRNHPKATEHIEVCKIKGNWAMTSCGRKRVDATGFEFLDKE